MSRGVLADPRWIARRKQDVNRKEAPTPQKRDGHSAMTTGQNNVYDDQCMTHWETHLYLRHANDALMHGRVAAALIFHNAHPDPPMRVIMFVLAEASGYLDRSCCYMCCLCGRGWCCDAI